MIFTGAGTTGCTSCQVDVEEHVDLGRERLKDSW
jgi:hypothetical protein